MMHCLRAIEAKATTLAGVYLDRILGTLPSSAKDLAIFVDTMDKLIITVDGVDIKGSLIVTA